MNIDLVLKRLELIKESKGINTISDTEASIILKEIERLNNIIKKLENYLLDMGMPRDYLKELEDSDK